MIEWDKMGKISENRKLFVGKRYHDERKRKNDLKKKTFRDIDNPQMN